MQLRKSLVRRLMQVVVLAAAVSVSARADITFGFIQDGLAATATFSAVGDTLLVTLENTAVVDVANPGDVLTGVFFDVNGFSGDLTHVSAVLTSVANAPAVLFGAGLGNTGLGYNDYAGAGDIGSESGYRTGAAAQLVGTGDHAIGQIGMDDFLGEGTRFDLDDTHNLQGPVSLNGIEYGMVNSTYLGGGNAPVNGPSALVRNSVLYTFTGFTGFGEGDIGNVSFNYGTEFNPIPVPGAALLGVIGLAAVRGVKRRLS